jgi:hypothetical protein
MDAKDKTNSFIDGRDDPHARTSEWPWVPQFTTDHAAAYAVEERIAEMGLTKQYAWTLTSLLKPHVSKRNRLMGDGLFLLLHASPAQRCCAAWVTVKMREGER